MSTQSDEREALRTFIATDRNSNAIPIVVIESPFAGASALSDSDAISYADGIGARLKQPTQVGNAVYLNLCILDCVKRGESPYASHKMLTDSLDDADPKQRGLGIALGYRFYFVASTIAFYVDRGWSKGMRRALATVQKCSFAYEVRSLHFEAGAIPDRLLPPLPSNREALARWFEDAK